eukprot:6077912-Prymnesium_polylepis.1
MCIRDRFEPANDCSRHKAVKRGHAAVHENEIDVVLLQRPNSPGQLQRLDHRVDGLGAVEGATNTVALRLQHAAHHPRIQL